MFFASSTSKQSCVLLKSLRCSFASGSRHNNTDGFVNSRKCRKTQNLSVSCYFKSYELFVSSPSERKKPNQRASLQVTNARKNRRNAPSRSFDSGELHIECQPDGSDTWRVDPAVELIKRGGVGIIPTDTMYAFVCDINCPAAVELMYRIKEMNALKKLSIICRDFSDIDTYTNGFDAGAGEQTGFPMSSGAGSHNTFKLAKKSLPGPYTLIMPASKAVPKQIFSRASGKKSSRARRHEVGVRIPNDPVCQSVLQQLSSPLLCTSVPLTEPAAMLDEYGPRGLSFLIDVGIHPDQQGSTVVDLTTAGDPVILRAGKGDTTIWDFDFDYSTIDASEFDTDLSDDSYT